MSMSSFSIAVIVCLASAASARPFAPELMCEVYPTAPSCRGTQPACTVCHTAAPRLNAFGAQVASNISGSLQTGLPAALAAIEGEDADGDGITNLQELADGTSPGDAQSVFRARPAVGSEPKADAGFAHRRMMVAFCGRSPNYEEQQAVVRSADPWPLIHQRLTACLASDYWRKEAVTHMADPLIRPDTLLGHCQLTFLDYEPDYHLFQYAMTGGRDARLLLLAKTFVEPDAEGTLREVEQVSPNRTRAGIASRSPFGPPQQNVGRNQRAGMMTTQQFLVNGIQGTWLPRVAGAQAYRAWLGLDLSQYEGVAHPPEPLRDLDAKGITQPVCASCHTTLDPLSYAFAYYAGAAGPRGGFGSYWRSRPEEYLGNGATQASLEEWYANPPQPMVFRQPLGLEYELPEDTSSVVKFAEIAAQSPAFARHVTRLLFIATVGNQPEPRDATEFEQLWRGLSAENFSIDALAHRLIETRAFGGER